MEGGTAAMKDRHVKGILSVNVLSREQRIPARTTWVDSTSFDLQMSSSGGGGSRNSSSSVLKCFIYTRTCTLVP